MSREIWIKKYLSQELIIISDKGKKVIKIIFFWVLMIAAALLATWPFLNSYYVATDFNSDAFYHIPRFIALSQEILHWNFPININAAAANGYGRPEGLFYPQFFLMLPAALVAWGMNALISFKFYIFLLNLATLLITYWVGKKMFKNSVYAWVMALLFTFAPYRIGDITHRVALGEFQAFTFMPLFIYSIYDILYVKHDDGTKAAWWWLPLSFFGILNSHDLSAEFMIVALVIFLLLNCVRIIKDKSILMNLVKAGVASVLVALSYFLPLLEQVAVQAYNWPQHWDSMPDMVSTLNLLFSNKIDSFAYFWGKGALLVLPLIFLVIPRWDKKISRRFIWHSLGIGLLFLILTTNLVNWTTLYNILPYENFPYRLNIVFVALIIFAVTYAFSNLARGNKIVQGLLIVVVVLNCYATMKPLEYKNRGTDNYYWSVQNALSFARNPNYNTDYFPANFNPNDAIVDFSAHVNGQDLEVSVSGKKHIVDFTSDTSFAMQMPVVYYKGYVAYTTDGKMKLPLKLTEDGGAHVVVSGDKALGEVVVAYKATFLQISSKIVSYAAILFLFWLAFFEKGEKRWKKLIRRTA